MPKNIENELTEEFGVILTEQDIEEYIGSTEQEF